MTINTIRPTRREALIAVGLAPIFVSQVARAQTAGSDIDLQPENLILTLDDASVTAMVDLLPFKAKIVALQPEQLELGMKALSLKVLKLIEDEIGTSDLGGLKHLSVRFVFVNQRDEYDKPRPGGLENIAFAEADLVAGKPGVMTVKLK